jgi:hypothetical protein
MTVLQAGRAARSRAWSGEAFAVALPLVATALGVASLLTMADQAQSETGRIVMIIGMTLGMMSPFAIPLGRAVARATLWWHARAAVIVALLVFLGVWSLAATALHLIGEALALVITPAWAIAFLTACCVGAQIGYRRLRLLAACQVTQPIYQDQHVPGAARWASLSAARCIRACAVPMTLTAVQPSLAGFTGVAVLLWVERFAGRPQLRLPLALGYLAIGAAMLASLGGAGLAGPIGHLGHH